MPEDPCCQKSQSLSAATTVPPDVSMVPSPTSAPLHHLSGLAPLVDDLSRAVTCPICLDHMEDARQLQCGHLFCAACVTGMLGMDIVRCAVCKEKTGKRMVRDAPVRYDQVVAYLHVLQDILVECNIRPKENDIPALNDGYGNLPSQTVRRIQSALAHRKTAAAPDPQNGKAEALNATPMHKRCYLCPKGVDALAFGDKVTFGDIFPAISEKKRSLFVHERCAVFSDGINEENGSYQNVEKLVVRTNKIVCGRDACGRTRANIECAAGRCKVRYHFPCAVVDGCSVVEDGFKIFCPKHKDLAPTIDEREFKKTLSDPNDVTAQKHDDSCYLCQKGGRLLMCDTCDRVAHPVCSGLRNLPTGDWSCGVCTGVEHAVKGARKKDSGRKKPSSKRRRESKEREESLEVDDQDELFCSPVVTKVKKRARKAVDGSKRYVLAHTGLHDLEKDSLKSIAKAKKTMVRSDIDRRVTHLVIRPYTREENPIRTMKLCKAIAAKTTIMCWKWIEDSVEAETWLPVEDHAHPLTWPKDEPSVFEGLRFYFGAYNGPKEKKDDLASVVTLGGGTLLNREPSVESAGGKSILYVRDEDCRQNGRASLGSRYEPPPGVTAIPASWILDQCTKDRQF